MTSLILGGSIRRMAYVVSINTFALAIFGFAQFFLSRGMIYWSYPAGAAFGPFVCRNHYPFYAYIGLGLTVGLMLKQAKDEYVSKGKGVSGTYCSLTKWLSTVSQSPVAVMSLSAATVIVLSIPFSLSRGGMLTLAFAGIFVSIVAAATMGRKVGTGLIAAGTLTLFAFGLGAWLGWGPIERRLGGQLEGQTVDNRSELWTAALRIAKKYPLFGSGGNTFQRVEPTVRVPNLANNVTLINDSVHNEYLEALAEGGLLRFAFTLLIAITPVYASVKAYRRLHSRSVGTMALGMSFGLFAVAVHSFFDFGIHIPAIALLAATIAAYAQAAATDPDFQPTWRAKTSGTVTVGLRDMGDDARSPDLNSFSVTGPPSIAVCIVLFIGMALLVRQYRSWDKAERYAVAATAETKAKDKDLDHFDRRIALCAARVGYSPDDPEAHAALARANFDVLVPHIDASKTSLKESIPDDLVKKYVQRGLRAARAARMACPQFAVAQMRLAVYRDFFTSTDSAKVYFDRVKKLAPCDPEAWFASGLEAYERGDINSAINDWKQSLTLNIRQLVPVLKIASPKLETDQILVDLLPDDPTVLLSAVQFLYPNRAEQKNKRQPYLDRVKYLVTRFKKPSVTDYVALAQAEYEMDNVKEAMKAWQSAIEVSPYDAGLRRKFADWLEAEEEFGPLVSELEWLRQAGYGGSHNTDRLDAARHAYELKQIIDK